tara:strand:- start:1110 stop:2147 length:1038 start_codon:yes stop_codon:yes gene_type:complete
MKSGSPSKAVMIWLWIGIGMILTMVVIGGLTRLTHSGLSMVHWTFAGSLPPMDEASWIAEFDRYKTSPEYIELHSHFSLDDFKSIYWWEYIHRMFGRLIGLVFIIPFAFFVFTKRISKAMLPKFFVILALGATQALLGWLMVKSGLVDMPRVSHYRLAAHLTTAFITCSYIFWVLLQYRDQNMSYSKSNSTSWAWLLGGGLVFQIVYGGFVAGLKAGWVHNTWPLMDGHIIAPAVWAMDSIFQSLMESKSGVQFVHRTMGLLVFGLAIYTAYQNRVSQWLRKPTMLFAICITIQFLLGVTTLLLHTPIKFAVTHQVFALVTLLSWVWLLYSFKHQKSSEGIQQGV